MRETLDQVLLAAQPERRSEARVHLRVMLQLQGTDCNDKPFDEVSATENVSHSAFLCGSTALLKKELHDRSAFCLTKERSSSARHG